MAGSAEHAATQQPVQFKQVFSVLSLLMLFPNGLLILGVVSVGLNTATCIHYLNLNIDRLPHSIGVLFSIT